MLNIKEVAETVRVMAAIMALANELQLDLACDFSDCWSVTDVIMPHRRTVDLQWGAR